MEKTFILVLFIVSKIFFRGKGLGTVAHAFDSNYRGR